MKKKTLFIIPTAIIAGAVLVPAIGLSILNNLPKKDDVLAYAEADQLTMVFNSSDGSNIKYHYLTREFTKKNYNEQDIVFNYKRCRYVSSSYSFAMSSGAEIYNPYISDSPNLNSLCGITSITVNFTTETGKLYLAYGLDENYIDSGIELESGIPFDFTSIKPSHFKLFTKDNGVNASNDIYVRNITINYNSDNYYDSGVNDYNQVIGSQSVVTLASGASHTYQLNSTDISTNNYLNIPYRATGNFTAQLAYYDTTKSKNVNEEIFFEASDKLVDFNTFLDNFRKGSSGITSKKLTSLTIKNVSPSTATFTLLGVNYTDRTYSRTDTLYISDSTIEAGVSLQFAGAISSIKNLNQGIQEYVDTNHTIKIRGSDKHSGDVNNVIANNPNLINIFDVGREVQQSWYINVDEEQGYTRGTFNDAEVGYNPVQAGDKNNNESQIVDYKVTYDVNEPTKVTSIWVKTKALDWAQTNSLSKSYMENTYKIENGLLRVSNRFVDFSGWTNYETNANWPQGNNNTNGNTFLSAQSANLFAIQELPAFYTAHPLNYYSSYFSDSMNSKSGKLIFDNNIGWNTSENGTNGAVETNNYLVANGEYMGETTYQTDLSAMNAAKGTSYSKYHYEYRKHYENWLGFFNEDKFGVAIYMPANEYNHETGSERHVFLSGMYSSDHGASNTTNRKYLDANYKSQTASWSKGLGSTGWGKIDLTKESCYVSNTGYFCTSLGLYIPNYTAIEYSYLIGADYLNILRKRSSYAFFRALFFTYFTHLA